MTLDSTIVENGGANITRFVTGAQKTERHHVETAFDICLQTAKLAIKEFRESGLDCCTIPTNTAEGSLMAKELEATTVEHGLRPKIDGMVGGLGRSLGLAFWAVRGLTYRLLMTLLRWV